MPSDSVAAFLELARELRLLPDADLARLAGTPDADDLPAVCRGLVAAGTLTRYQADRVLTGRGYTLGFAGFVIAGEIDAHTATAVEANTRTAVRLSRFPAGHRPPARSPHPSLAASVLAGSVGGDGYAVFRTPDGEHLSALIADMGPMPAKLAAEYTRQAAVPLAAAHAAGAVHGHVCPERLFVSPLVQASKPKADGSPRFRPGPTAAVSVTDFGLPAPGTAADDVFRLGGVLFLLLTGREPGGASLSATRPDCPPELVSLAKGMLALAPADRPTMADVIARLTPIISPNGSGDAVRLGKGSDPAVPVGNVTLAENDHVELADDPPRLALADGWAGHPAVAVPPPAFTPQAWVPPPATEADHHDDAPAAPRRRAAKGGGSRQMLWILAGAFVLINVLAVLVWFLLIALPAGKK